MRKQLRSLFVMATFGIGSFAFGIYWTLVMASGELFAQEPAEPFIFADQAALLRIINDRAAIEASMERVKTRIKNKHIEIDLRQKADTKELNAMQVDLLRHQGALIGIDRSLSQLRDTPTTISATSEAAPVPTPGATP